MDQIIFFEIIRRQQKNIINILVLYNQLNIIYK
jgi:hypothetical protein